MDEKSVALQFKQRTVFLYHGLCFTNSVFSHSFLPLQSYRPVGDMLIIICTQMGLGVIVEWGREKLKYTMLIRKCKDFNQ